MVTFDPPVSSLTESNIFSPGGHNLGEDSLPTGQMRKRSMGIGALVPVTGRPAAQPGEVPWAGTQGLARRPRGADSRVAPRSVSRNARGRRHQHIHTPAPKPNIEACHLARIAAQDKAICMDPL